ncbi:unnamed protein product [Gordionus sp. m RMFG-2023]|uniref:large ribosomal subunit protein uL29m-like n=1 Tax=Gordionus sp. m RMFG-2023 TaxID=3053472 RepID=UPI0030DF1FB8
MLHRIVKLLCKSSIVSINMPKKFSITLRVSNLMEFFDIPENWDKTDIKHGKSWLKEDLRIKSNQDLHKLWFILYKEKNMLLTMQSECKRINKLFASPERIDKVEESMANLENVVQERNNSLSQLEKGTKIDREGKVLWHPLGIKVYREANEWPIPFEINSEEKAKNYKEYMIPNDEVIPFWRELREKHRTIRWRSWQRNRKLKMEEHKLLQESRTTLKTRILKK